MARSQISAYDKANIEKIIRGHGDWFSANLIRLIRDADLGNREAIREMYPDHVAAFEAWRDGPAEDERSPFGRCDQCGAPCDADGCTVDREHEAVRE